MPAAHDLSRRRVLAVMGALMLGDAARGARPDHRLHRPADDRRRARRARPPLLGGHRLPARLDGRRRRCTASSATSTAASAVLPGAPSSSSSSARCSAGSPQSMVRADRLPRASRASAAAGSWSAPRRSIGDVVPPRERGRYHGLLRRRLRRRRASPGRCSAASSPSHLSWRWIFYVNLPLGIAGAGRRSRSCAARAAASAPHAIDYLGAALLGVGAARSIVLADHAGAAPTYAWSSPVDRRPRRARASCSLVAFVVGRAPGRRAGPAAAAVPQPRLQR